MKRIIITIVLLCLITVPQHSEAVLKTLSEEEINKSEQYGMIYKEKTGILLNNAYTLGKIDLFTERVIIRTKWHKLGLLAGFKAQQKHKPSEKERADILNDPYLQIDIILFGYSIYFARDYTAVLSQNGTDLAPDKIHADHFQLEQSKHNVLTGFPTYRATIRTYFDYDRFNPQHPISLIIKKNGDKNEFRIDLNRYK